MGNIERRVAREARAMTRREVITKAIDGQLSWVAAADIIGVTPRQMRRIRRAIERDGPARWTPAAQAGQGADG